MRNSRRKRETFAEPSYWQSYSDMMAALLLIFVLIIAITLAIYKQKTTDLELTRLELSAAEADLENSRVEIEKSNKELAASLAELQVAYAVAALTKEVLNNAYLEIENAREELATTKSELLELWKVSCKAPIMSVRIPTISCSSLLVVASSSLAFSISR